MLNYRRVTRCHSSPTFDVGRSRDATISFECVSGSVKVVETVGGNNIQSRITLQELDVVRELEEKYIFFADEAEIARKLIRRGRSCVLSVYFREP
jgi:hypothetical protein